jgi:soluble lytic murein transglycosylase-like protein
LETLRFGRRARRRVRVRRLALGAWVATMAGPILGVPTGMELLGRLEPEAPPVEGLETSDSTAALLRFRREAFDARPAERPQHRQRRAEGRSSGSAAPEPYAPGSSIPDIIGDAATEFGIDGGYLLAVAQCESDLDPGAVSGGGYHGLFQFDERTWDAYGYGSIYDPVAQARTAARLLAAGQADRWPNCA